jgi:hypothetical protein
MKIAVIGSGDNRAEAMSYDAVKLEAFILKLAEKYPHATIVTGNGRGAEAATKALAQAIGLTVEQPELRDDLYGKAALACQINDVLIGADQIVIVGNATGVRPATAIAIHKRVDFTTAYTTRAVRPLHVIAAPPPKKKAAPKRRATKPDKLAA